MIFFESHGDRTCSWEVSREGLVVGLILGQVGWDILSKAFVYVWEVEREGVMGTILLVKNKVFWRHSNGTYKQTSWMGVGVVCV